MTDDRWARIDTLLQAALMRPPEAREMFVNDACGDDSALRAEVMSLLAHTASADGFLEPAPTESRKPLEPGQTLGPYTIAECIGAGGMGEVYRARDPRLGRDVAIKILPSALAVDPDRLRRFEQEARAAAALNHPNIVTIYSVEHADGDRFLTMELVEGTVLSDRIQRDGLPVDRLLEIAVPLADAIGAAHARGIVHRDLKPANLMLTREGRIKVLDFGLAKLKRLIGAENLATSPAPAATAEGRLLGTVAYMSPEQAEGREVDHRSDIFSLGVLLYELATGQRPFKGDTSVSLLSSILKDSPPSLTEVKRQIPRELARIVRRCLAKDPERRYQSAKDVRIELEELREEIASGALERPDSAAGRLRRWKSFAWIAAGTTALTAMAVGYLAWRGAIDWQPRPQLATIASRVEFSVPVPDSVKTIQSLSVSPDGTQLAFVGGGQLWRFELATRSTSAVTGVVGVPQLPFWAPDGRFIAYFQANTLMKIPASGGAPTKVCALEGAPRGGTWGAENTIVFARVKTGLFRVPAVAGGVPVAITQLSGDEEGHLWPQFLPDGRHFTYMSFESLNKVYIASLDLDVPRRLVAPAHGVQIDLASRAFALSGFLLTAEEGRLRARPLSATGTDPAVEPEFLAQDLRFGGSSGDHLFAASPAVLAYGVTKSRRSQFSIVGRRNREPAAVGSPVFLDPRVYGRAMWSLSPNGRTLAFTQAADDRRNHIWLLDLMRTAPERFTSGPYSALLPQWNSKGDQIMFTRDNAHDGQSLNVKRLGSESDSRMTESAGWRVAYDWHGNTLLFARQTSTGVYNFWHLATDGSRKEKPWFSSKFAHSAAQFSPDGRWVAYSSNETDARQVYLRRFPEADRQVKVSTVGGNTPRWRPDGKALFYLQDDALMEVGIAIGENVKTDLPHELFRLGENCGYAVLPDGRFVVCRPIDPVPPPAITVVLNWAAGLERR